MVEVNLRKGYIVNNLYLLNGKTWIGGSVAWYQSRWYNILLPRTDLPVTLALNPPYSVPFP